MADVNERLEEIERRLEELERSSVESRLEQFRGRIDDLRVQSSLARLDARDEVKQAFDSLESAWRDVRAALENLSEDGRSAGSTLAAKAKDAFGDLRDGIEKAADTLRQKD
jgi:flagellar hook-associated protein FlgK